MGTEREDDAVASGIEQLSAPVRSLTTTMLDTLMSRTDEQESEYIGADMLDAFSDHLSDKNSEVSPAVLFTGMLMGIRHILKQLENRPPR